MNKKLLLFNLKSIFRILVYYLAGVLLCALLYRILNPINSVPLLHHLAKLFLGIMVGLMVGTFICNIGRIWESLYHDFFKESAYFYRSLPFSSKTLFDSKVLAGLISLFVSSLVCILGLMIAEMDPAHLQMVMEWTAFALSMPVSSLYLILGAMIVLIFLEFFYITLAGDLSILVCVKRFSHPILAFVIMTLLILLVNGLILVGILGVISLFDPSVAAFLFNSDGIAYNRLVLGYMTHAVPVVLITGIVVYSVGSIILFLACRKLVQKGVEVIV